MIGKPLIILPYGDGPGCFGRLLALVRSWFGYALVVLVGFGLGFVLGAR